MRDKVPFNCITGPTNCGKTHYLVNQLKGAYKGVFDYIVLICLTYVNNKKYRDFHMDNKRFFVASPDASNGEEINEFLKDCTTLFSGTNTLIILDDCS